MTHRVYAAIDVQLVVAGVTDAKYRDHDMLCFLTSARVSMSMNKQADVHKKVRIESGCCSAQSRLRSAATCQLQRRMGNLWRPQMLSRQQ